MTDSNGWAGASLLLLAYGLNSLEKLPKKSSVYHACNFVGALFLAISAASQNSKPFLVLNAIWTIVALWQFTLITLSVRVKEKMSNPIIEMIWRGIPRPGSKEMDELAEAQRYNQTNNNVDKDLINHLYGCLSSIDAKSGALLTNNSLWMAVIAIFSSSDGFGFDKTSPWELLAALLAFALIFFSSALALVTLYIRWSSAHELRNPDILSHTLLIERANRTVRFRFAIILSAAGAAILTAYVLIKYMTPLSILKWGF